MSVWEKLVRLIIHSKKAMAKNRNEQQQKKRGKWPQINTFLVFDSWGYNYSTGIKMWINLSSFLVFLRKEMIFVCELFRLNMYLFHYKIESDMIV